jgi:Domain of unknown function (DUF4410)
MKARAGHLARRAALVAVVLSSACAPTEVTEHRAYSGTPLGRPDVVLVRNFAVTPGEVRLDQGVSARVARAVDDSPASEQEIAVGRQVVRAIAATLAEELNRLGLPAQTSDAAVEAAWEKRLVIDGQIVSIDEGNRTRRNAIGLGAGRTQVEADAQVVYETRTAPPRLLESFEAVAESGRKPGLAEGMGVGAALGRIATTTAVGVGADTASELSGATVEADGHRMGEQIAKKLTPFLAAQGWIAAR